MHFLHTVLCIHFLKCWKGEFVQQASFGYNKIRQNHPTWYLLLVSCLLFLIIFGIKRHNKDSSNQYFEPNIKVKLWLTISRISWRELDVYHFSQEQCNCDIYRDFDKTRYMVIDCKLLRLGYIIPYCMVYLYQPLFHVHLPKTLA